MLRFTFLILILLMAPLWAEEIQVEVNGKRVQFLHPPTTVDGRLLVPLKEMFEAMEARVDYHQPSESFRASFGSQVVQVLVGRRTAIVNGQPVYLEVPAELREDTVFIPLRFVTESLGAVMQWDQETRTAHLTPGATTNVQTAPTLISGPKIERVEHNGTLLMKPGDILEVVIFGDAGCRAEVSLGRAAPPLVAPEVAPGRYQLSYTLPPALRLNQVQVQARLIQGERSAQKLAAGAITVKPPASGKATWVVTPAPDSILMHNKPQFTATFPQQIHSNSLRFELDGQDRTAEAQVTSSFLWRPAQDLSNGLHRATIKALNTKGDTLKYTWSFFVQGS